MSLDPTLQLDPPHADQRRQNWDADRPGDLVIALLNPWPYPSILTTGQAVAVAALARPHRRIRLLVDPHAPGRKTLQTAAIASGLTDLICHEPALASCLVDLAGIDAAVIANLSRPAATERLSQRVRQADVTLIDAPPGEDRYERRLASAVLGVIDHLRTGYPVPPHAQHPTQGHRI